MIASRVAQLTVAYGSPVVKWRFNTRPGSQTFLNPLGVLLRAEGGKMLVVGSGIVVLMRVIPFDESWVEFDSVSVTGWLLVPNANRFEVGFAPAVLLHVVGPVRCFGDPAGLPGQLVKPRTLTRFGIEERSIRYRWRSIPVDLRSDGHPRIAPVLETPGVFARDDQVPGFRMMSDLELHQHELLHD